MTTEGVGINRDEPHATMSLAEHGDGPYGDEDQDEDGDVDFNPFLNEVPSPEASSSLSSEIECLDLHVVDSNENTVESMAIDSMMLIDGVQESAIEDSERGEDEFVMQASDFPRGVFQTESQNYMSENVAKRRSVLFSNPENETVQVHENGASSETDVNDEESARNLSSMIHYKNPLLDFDNEDAICKRTRARYSLTSFTLDELETFLQETDDEDDIQNVDDEEEYRKFLASVLLGDSDGHAHQENIIVDDEDEDNDADFEIEIEEALESDLDENTIDKPQKYECEEASRRPETRQTKRQKRASRNNQKKLSQQIDRPLRPLVPIMPNAPFVPFHTSDMRSLMPKASQCLSSPAEGVSVNGFTPHQIGQLHCLIHEHVQLLIQVFSISVLDPTRQHIASQVQGLISDMLSKRDQTLAWRNLAYPASWFSRPFLQPMGPAELHTGFRTHSISESSVTPDPQRDAMSVEQPHLYSISHCERRNEYIHLEQSVFPKTIDGFPWTPFIGGPLLSILDVAPLNLVERYMDDVKIAVHEYRRRLLEDTCERNVDREPMFPLPSFPTYARASEEVSATTSTPTVDTLPSSSPSHKQPKKTLAATLVESSMKQSVALVPKVIVKLSQRFFQLFNPALFPRKPPPPPVANRVLFTDAEDELLALGLMEYNSDWKAIQQRFLPCKSKHQIFVRQKNRSSSKAPENPIKAVKRLKNSSLTADELARIQEGLRIFKLDWMSIWKFMVPHRDPSLLPRQWRIALGTQKSYKIDPAKKERRRLYETKRRINLSNLPNWKALSGREDDGTEILGQHGENSSYNEDEAYVHEAFLADWRPSTANSLSREGTYVREQLTENNTGKELPCAPINSGHPYAASNFAYAGYGTSLTGKPNPGSSKPPLYMRPYRARRSFNPHLVKLAPELPPVNLPSSARVISQSARKSYHCEPSAEVSISGGSIANLGTTHLLEVRRTRTNSLENSNPSHLEESRVIRNTRVTEEKGTEVDLRMHPLLFKATPNDGHFPYFPLKCGPSSSSPFSFCTRNHPEVSLSLLHNPYQADPSANRFKENSQPKETNLSSAGVDFHPLLQRTSDMNSELVGPCSNEHLSVDLESFKGKFAHPQSCSDANQRDLHNNGDPSATSTKCYKSNPNKKISDLDLDIHLSLTSDMATTSSNLVSKAHDLVAPSNNITRGSMEDVGDQSLQEIVMEHEELSDSDEQVEGIVEFECEEMADSEGEEGSDCEEITDSHTKETPNYTVEKVSKVANGEDYAQKSSWLSLDSSVPGLS